MLFFVVYYYSISGGSIQEEFSNKSSKLRCLLVSLQQTCYTDNKEKTERKCVCAEFAEAAVSARGCGVAGYFAADPVRGGRDGLAARILALGAYRNGCDFVGCGADHYDRQKQSVL